MDSSIDKLNNGKYQLVIIKIPRKKNKREKVFFFFFFSRVLHGFLTSCYVFINILEEIS